MRNMEGMAIHTVTVAHVTYTITKDEIGIYRLYSQSKKQMLHQHRINEWFDYGHSFEEVSDVLTREITELEQRLEDRRSGYPTPAQVYFLFCQKIPIPIDLTWGQASDIIERCLIEKKRIQREAKKERFNGFEVGMRVRYACILDGKQQTITSEITKLTSNNKGNQYAYIKVGKGEMQVPLKILKKVEEEVAHS